MANRRSLDIDVCVCLGKYQILFTAYCSGLTVNHQKRKQKCRDIGQFQFNHPYIQCEIPTFRAGKLNVAYAYFFLFEAKTKLNRNPIRP